MTFNLNTGVEAMPGLQGDLQFDLFSNKHLLVLRYGFSLVITLLLLINTCPLRSPGLWSSVIRFTNKEGKQINQA